MPKPYFRQDGFTPVRRVGFLKALAKVGCVADACRSVGMSTTSAYRVRARDAGFAADWARAQAMAGAHLEGVLYARAVVGTDTEIWREGKLVEVRRKPSDALLRLMLQAASPRKYGRTGRSGETAKQIEARVRGEIEEAGHVSEEETAALRAKISRKLDRLGDRLIEQEGYSRGPSGSLVPPGWRMVPVPDTGVRGKPMPGWCTQYDSDHAGADHEEAGHVEQRRKEREEAARRGPRLLI